jgi:ABC-type transport system involved in cytochrome c biogenesis permease subunit
MNWTFQVTLALYTVGLLHSLLGFYQKRQIFVNLALWMVGCGFVSHTAFLVLLGIERRHFPLTNLPESLSFFAWCVTLTFILANIRYRTNVLGAFVLPLVSLLTLFSELVWEENHSIPPLLKSNWIYFHSTVAFLAYAAFFLTFISGILYLIQEKELKSKKFRFFYFRLPSLQVCDELLRRSLFVGFILMSITIVTGALWPSRRGAGSGAGTPRRRRRSSRGEFTSSWSTTAFRRSGADEWPHISASSDSSPCCSPSE